MWTFFQALHSGKRSARKSGARGFTLIELLVVVSIMVIMTSIFLLRQQRFNSATILRSLAYSVGLSIRQAQVYGVSTRESSVGAFSAGTAAKAYGVHFSSGSTNSYTLFADLNNDGQYTVSPSEVVQVFSIGQGYTISRFCVTTSGISPTQRCSDSGSPLTSMTVLFKRPNPDACFAASGGGGSANACQTGAVPSETYSTGCMRVQGAGGSSDTRSVTVSLTGQISIGGTGTCGT